MKSGFHAEITTDKDEIQRADQNLPLNKFGIAGLDWVWCFQNHYKSSLI